MTYTLQKLIIPLIIGELALIMTQNKKQKYIKNKNIKIKFLTLNDCYESKYFGKWAYTTDQLINNEQDLNTIYVKLFAGDYLFPNKYSSFLLGHDMVLASNASEFNAIGIGNHEFDNGLAQLSSLALMSNCPILCSNLDPEIVIQSNLKTNYKFTKNGITFGAIGYVTQETSQISIGAKNLSFEDIDYVFQTQKKFLSSCDIKILLFHDNIEVIVDYLEANPKKKYLVDIIVTGHQHILYAEYIQRKDYRIPIVQAGQDAKGLGYIELEYNQKCKKLISSFVEVKDIPIDTPESPEIKLLTEWVELVSEPYFSKIIGVVKNYPLNALRTFIRNNEANMGDLIADAYLFTGKEFSLDSPIENRFAIINSGSIRNNSNLSIDYNITGKSIYEIIPFPNIIVAVEIIGRENVNNLINYLGTLSKSKKNTGAWLQISNNLFFDYKTNSYQLLGATSGPNDKFYLIVDSFIADGGDGYSELAKYKQLAIDVPIQTSLINYITSLGGIVSYPTEGNRIVLP